MYLNYHKHTHYSNIYTIDSNAKVEDYCKRAVELKQDTIFTTEHGWGGDVFDYKTTCDKYSLKCVYAVEGYIVKDSLQKDASNYHIMIIPTNDIARKKLNKMLTRANKEGFYYKPRLFLSDLLNAMPTDYYITTACIAGIVRDKEGYDNVFMPLYKHFGQQILLEVQDHNHPKQIEHNKNILEMAKSLNLRIIHANDSHYIYPQDSKDRQCLLQGKNINYGDEDSFILDYPDEQTIYERYKTQGVLAEQQVKEALDNTLLFKDINNLILDKEIKMPNIYPQLTIDQRIEKLKGIIATNFKQIIKDDCITSQELPKYKQMIKEEMQVIVDTKELNTVDYFLLNYKLVHLAIDKYKGVLTTTGRGSAGSFYLNRCLGITQLDRGRSKIPLYYERFMSKDRLLANHSLPDIDYNVVDPQPFIDASKELLGENSCRWMSAWGALKRSEAFRNTCRSMNIPFEEYNNEALEFKAHDDDSTWEPSDEKWKNIYRESHKYLGTIVSASVHPCSNLLLDKDIEYELGCIKLGDVLCAPITSGEADDWKYLKNDYLTVTTVDITKRVFDLINIPRMTLQELEQTTEQDKKTWDIYANGITCTINQVDSDWATELVKTYKPQNIFELANFTGCLRPSFENFRQDFVNRVPFHNLVPQLDTLFTATNNYIIYQENLMQFFEFLGVSPAKSISLIKKISKKHIKQEDFDALVDTLKQNWVLKMGSETNFNETWTLIQSYMSYGYNSPHALAMAYDSLYNAYLKSHYPLEYYAIVFELYNADIKRTQKLTNELSYFNIKLEPPCFGKSKAQYTIDKPNNALYKGIGSIKYLNSKVADELYDLSQLNKYDGFFDLLDDISQKTSLNSKQLNILISLDYFKMFGKSKKLLQYVTIYNKFIGKKTIKKEDIILPITETLSITFPFTMFRTYCIKETEKTYSGFNSVLFVKDYWNNIKDEEISLDQKILAQKEYLGYITYVNPKLKNIYMVTDFETPYDKSKPNIEVYSLSDGTTEKWKVKNKDKFDMCPFKKNSIIQLILLEQHYRNKKEIYTEGAEGWSKKEINMKYRWIKSTETEWVLNDWKVIK